MVSWEGGISILDNDFLENYQSIITYYNQEKEHKLPFNKFIILEDGYWSGRRETKMSIINNNEFAVVTYSNLKECIDIIRNNLSDKYNRIVIRGVNEYVLQDYLGIGFSIWNIDENIIQYLRDNQRIDLLGAYIELCRLEHNERLLDNIL